MFGFFIRKRKEPVTNTAIEKIANTIVTKSIRIQERWAAFMQGLTEKLSTRSKKWSIILFCLLAGGYSLYTIIESFSAKKKKPFVLTNIKTPKYFTHSSEEDIQAIITIPEREYQKIIQFRKYMDSLSGTKTGKKIADSILLKRPGLTDSIIQIEQLYHLQQSSKK